MTPVVTIKRAIICIAMCTFFATSMSPAASASTPEPVAPGWQIGYGQGPEQVSFANASNTPNFEEAAPFGPMAFRCHDGRLWLADSVRGRVLVFDGAGKLTGTLQLPQNATDTLLEDLAVTIDAAGKTTVTVADAATRKIYRFAWPSGKLEAEFGTPEQVVQVQQLEIDATDRTWVGDVGRGMLVVFDAAGKLVGERPWNRTGFVWAGGDRYYTILFAPGSGCHLVLNDLAGNVLSDRCLGMVRTQNPRLWAVDPDGTAWVTFIPPGGFRGELFLCGFDATGGLTAIGTVRPPAMNRFIERTERHSFMVAAADFERAPEGVVRVSELAGPAKPGKGTDALPTPTVSATTLATFTGPVPRSLIAENGRVWAILDDRSVVAVDWKTGKTESLPALNGAVSIAPGSGGAVLALDATGRLVTGLPTALAPSAGVVGTRVQVSADGVPLVTAPDRAVIVDPTASAPTGISGVGLVTPLQNGFFAQLTAGRQTVGDWRVELIDNLGNCMKQLHRFDPRFDPSGMIIGPANADGTFLLRCVDQGRAQVYAFGQNGRMLWRIEQPATATCLPPLVFGGPDDALLTAVAVAGGWQLQAIQIAQPKG